MTFGAPTPILRSFDEAKAREFYIDFLGFEIEFEHRFGPDAPLYMGLRRGDCALHLSEHHGDCSPGAQVRIPASGLKAYTQELRDKRYKYANPGDPTEKPWGLYEVSIRDPFGNSLTFFEPPE
ncbi:MAG: glyoxalase superfamily protein [Paracoccaceae bacterium]|nr:glyoxalase superfamily protein [Paracoccaceae bacterium]